MKVEMKVCQVMVLLTVNLMMNLENLQVQSYLQ